MIDPTAAATAVRRASRAAAANGPRASCTAASSPLVTAAVGCTPAAITSASSVIALASRLDATGPLPRGRSTASFRIHPAIASRGGPAAVPPTATSADIKARVASAMASSSKRAASLAGMVGCVEGQSNARH
jgi:hypothetical protein